MRNKVKFVSGCMKVKHTERQTERQIERQKDRKTERQTYRQKDGQINCLELVCLSIGFSPILAISLTIWSSSSRNTF